MEKPNQQQDTRLLNRAVYLVAVTLVMISITLFSNPLTIGAIAALALAFALVHRLALPRVHNTRRAVVYFAVQTTLVTGICLVAGSGDPFNFPFFILIVQVMFFFSPRVAAVWIIIFFLLGCATVALRQGGIGPVYLLFYLTAFAFTGVYGYTLRQAETAQRHNAQLLKELQLAQQQLHELAVTAERNRLARDLHDSAKQQAFALSAQLDAVRSLLHRDPVAAERHLQQAEGLADTIRQELAALILDLRPPALHQQSLAAALRHYVTEWARHQAITATMQVDGERALAPLVEQTLFRITQEALANVARHSQAKQVAVQLIYTENQVQITLVDDGQGFAPGQASSGLGLHSMRERASSLPQGSLTIESEPGQGTCVRVQCYA